MQARQQPSAMLLWERPRRGDLLGPDPRRRQSRGGHLLGNEHGIYQPDRTEKPRKHGAFRGRLATVRGPSTSAWGLVGVGATLATTAAAILGAASTVGIAMAVLAMACFLAAALQHWREGRASNAPPLSPRVLPEDQADWAQRQLLKRALGDLYQRGLFWQHDEENFGRWEGRAHELIKDALGEDEARLFLTAEEGSEAWTDVTPYQARARSRISRLATVMMRVDSLKPLGLRPEFDGEDWVSRR